MPPGTQTSTALTEFHATLVANAALLARDDWTNNALLSSALDLTNEVRGAKVLDIPVIPSVDGTTETEGTDVAYQQFSSSKVTLTVDTNFQVVMAFTPYAQARSNQELLSSYGRQAGINFAKTVDSALAGLYTSAGNSVDATSTADIDEADILAAKEILDAANAPQEGRVLVLHHTQYNALLAIPRFTDFQNTGRPDGVATGVIGNIHSFMVKLDQNMVDTGDGYRHNLAFVQPSVQGIAGAQESTIGFGFAQLPAARGGAISAGSAPRVTFSYDAKGNGSDILDVRGMYGVVAHRPEFLVDIQTQNT